jgi:hypothetical protein
MKEKKIKPKHPNQNTKSKQSSVQHSGSAWIIISEVNLHQSQFFFKNSINKFIMIY